MFSRVVMRKPTPLDEALKLGTTDRSRELGHGQPRYDAVNSMITDGILVPFTPSTRSYHRMACCCLVCVPGEPALRDGSACVRAGTDRGESTLPRSSSSVICWTRAVPEPVNWRKGGIVSESCWDSAGCRCKLPHRVPKFDIVSPAAHFDVPLEARSLRETECYVQDEDRPSGFLPWIDQAFGEGSIPARDTWEAERRARSLRGTLEPLDSTNARNSRP